MGKQLKKKIITLNGSWLLTAKDLGLSIHAEVPGSIYQDLLEAKIIPDPFYRDNEDIVRPYMNHDYGYSRAFYIEEEDLFNRQLKLVFAGIDTLADVYVNDQLILNSSNMHRRYTVDITGLLKAGINKIYVLIHSPLKYIKQEEENYPHPLFQVSDGIKGYVHLRKAHYMFGWDWGPQLPDGGIWRDVFIESILQAKFDDVLVEQNHHQDSVALTIQANLSNKDLSEGIIKLELFDPSQELIYESNEEIQKLMSIDIADPKRWFPIGYGDQNLYRLKLSLYSNQSLLDVYETTIGLRKVHLRQETDIWGESFTLEINGVKVFAKGSNYIPEDNLLSRTTYDLTYDLLKSARDANHNMVRVWGGGIYPPTYFYDICDQLGLMVWQDLMFACSIYPMDKAAFVSSIKAEIADNIKRIRNHPSLVLICGSNENETAIEHWNIPSLAISKDYYIKQYLDIIPNILNKELANIPYWRSSPASKDLFVDSNSDNYGDMHYWGVWHNNEPFTNYRKYYPRFMSEFGIQSFPTIETINTFAIEADKNIFSYVMEKHQKNKTANSKILNYIGSYFKYPKDFESLLFVSQAIQAEGVRYGVEHWRRNYGRCMGILYWQLNDCWPVASWSSIDYYHRWKILHYHSKKFYAPILLSIEETFSNAKIVITNDSLNDIVGQVTYQFVAFDGEILLTNTSQVFINAQSKKQVVDYEFLYQRETLTHTYLYSALEVKGQIISENTAFFLPDKHLNLVQPEIGYTLAKESNLYRIKLISKSLAKFVELKVAGTDIIFSDNYFHLMANKEKIVTFVSNKDIHKDQIRVKSLIDTF